MVQIFKESTEKILEKAQKESGKKRRKLFTKNIKNIKKFLYAEDAIPTRNQIKNNLEKILNDISLRAEGGGKLSSFSLTNSYKPTVNEIKRSIEEVLTKLKENKIKISELERRYCYTMVGQEKWSEEDIKDLPLDWIVGAVLNYQKNRSEEKDLDTKTELSATEVKECLEIIEKRNK